MILCRVETLQSVAAIAVCARQGTARIDLAGIHLGTATDRRLSVEIAAQCGRTVVLVERCNWDLVHDRLRCMIYLCRRKLEFSEIASHLCVKLVTLTLQRLLSPAGANALIAAAAHWRRIIVIDANRCDVLIELQIDLQMEQGNVTAERLVFGMEGNGFDAHCLERFRFLIAAQSPFAALDENVKRFLSIDIKGTNEFRINNCTVHKLSK